MHIKMKKALEITKSYRGITISDETELNDITVSIDSVSIYGENSASISTSIQFGGVSAPGDNYEFYPEPGGKVPMLQAYDHLMALDEFSGATLVSD